MKQELEGELFQKYPKIFNGALVGKHIKCEDGWFHLLDVLGYDLQYVCDHHPEIPQIQAVNVMKGVDGGLRFFFIGGNPSLWKAISQAEERSNYTCEECGDLGTTIYSKSHIKCLCPRHSAGL